MSIDFEIKRCSGLKSNDVKIMAQASVFLQGETGAAVEIRRGMNLISIEGQEAGRVAGVVISRDSRMALCLILSHLPEEAAYQSLPIRWIGRVEGEVIILNASIENIRTIPDWHTP